MSKFNQLIQSAVEGRRITNSLGRKNQYPSFANIHPKVQEQLIAALIEENEAIRERIENEINSALEDAMYQYSQEQEEAIEAACDWQNFIAEDAAERARDMSSRY